MPNTFDYIRVTDKNLESKDAIFDATVVANYGDPGLDEDYHADLLSRFVICKLESSCRTLTSDRYKNMLVVVRRPESLWISYQGGWLNQPTSQKRVDAGQNSNMGTAAAYSINAIPRINNPYRLGEKIKVKFIKAESYLQLSNQEPFFQSECDVWEANNSSVAYYQGWHNQGLNSDPYVTQNNGANNIQMKTIVPSATEGFYYMTVNKTQYEAFSLSSFPERSRALISLFNNTSTFNYYYQANGGYVFSSAFSVNLNFCKYEDINVENKARIGNTNCMPLIVTSPTTFTVPKSRNSGTVDYQPTYIEKA